MIDWLELSLVLSTAGLTAITIFKNQNDLAEKLILILAGAGAFLFSRHVKRARKK